MASVYYFCLLLPASIVIIETANLKLSQFQTLTAVNVLGRCTYVPMTHSQIYITAIAYNGKE